MRHTLTIREEQYDRLRAIVFARPDHEGAAYLLCGRSETQDEDRLLVREVIPVADEHYLAREQDHLSIDSASYAAMAKRARLRRHSLVFVHSHPFGPTSFSRQDDREEPKLMAFFTNQIPDRPHGSLVLAPETGLCGRVWTGSGWTPMERVRVLGTRFRFVDQVAGQLPISEFFARQVRAFGPDIQRLLQRLHVGVVGAGGTGSAVIEQLVRLGIGTLSVFDRDVFELSNMNRVYGATTGDAGRLKVDIQWKHVQRIGLGTTLHIYPEHITDEATARRLRECDLVFGCTDKQAPRGILVQLALRYLIPVFDTAVKIDAPEQIIRGIYGRVTTLLPGEACLFCRERITPEMIRLESLSPTEQQTLADEAYAPTLQTEDPAVIAFTTTVAAQAVAELLHRLTGFMGEERQSSEVLLFFHEGTIRANRVPARSECLCMQTALWGRGDSRDFLGLTWPEPSDR